MKLPVIKKLVETASLDELVAAEEAILNEVLPEIEVIGDDEGEQLTHIMAAIFIKTEMAEKSVDYMTALRTYTNKVRTSIS
jgi:hypothetical protein